MNKLQNSFIFGFGASGGRAAWRLFEENFKVFFIFGIFLILLSLLLLIALSPLYIIEASINNIFDDLKKYKKHDFKFFHGFFYKINLVPSYIILFLSLIVSFLAAPLIFLLYFIIIIILSFLSLGDLLENYLENIINTKFFIDYISPYNPYLMFNDIYLKNFDSFLINIYKECLTSFQGNLSLIYFTVALIIGIYSLFFNFKIRKVEIYENKLKEQKKEDYKKKKEEIKKRKEKNVNKIFQENIKQLEEKNILFSKKIFKQKYPKFFLLEFKINDIDFKLIMEINNIFYYQDNSENIILIEINNSDNSIKGIYDKNNFITKYKNDIEFQKNIEILQLNKNQQKCFETGFEHFDFKFIKPKDLLYKNKVAFEIKDINKKYIELYPKGTRGKRLYIIFNIYGLIDNISEIIDQNDFLKYLESLPDNEYDLNLLLKQKLNQS